MGNNCTCGEFSDRLELSQRSPKEAQSTNRRSRHVSFTANGEEAFGERSDGLGALEEMRRQIRESSDRSSNRGLSRHVAFGETVQLPEAANDPVGILCAPRPSSTSALPSSNRQRHSEAGSTLPPVPTTGLLLGKPPPAPRQKSKVLESDLVVDDSLDEVTHPSKPVVIERQMPRFSALGEGSSSGPPESIPHQTSEMVVDSGGLPMVPPPLCSNSSQLDSTSRPMPSFNGSIDGTKKSSSSSSSGGSALSAAAPDPIAAHAVGVSQRAVSAVFEAHSGSSQPATSGSSTRGSSSNFSEKMEQEYLRQQQELRGIDRFAEADGPLDQHSFVQRNHQNVPPATSLVIPLPRVHVSSSPVPDINISAIE